MLITAPLESAQGLLAGVFKKHTCWVTCASAPLSLLMHVCGHLLHEALRGWTPCYFPLCKLGNEHTALQGQRPPRASPGDGTGGEGFGNCPLSTESLCQLMRENENLLSFTFRVLLFAECFAFFFPFSLETILNCLINTEIFILKQILKIEKVLQTTLKFL